MGGSGSGRKGGREVVENCHSVDANDFTKWKFFKPGGKWGITKWTRSGQETGSCGVRTSIEDNRAACSFYYNDREEPVGLSWYSPGYGGRRYFFVCPVCGRRMRTLFFKQSKLACRICHDLTYTSCNESHYFDSLYMSMAIGMKVPCYEVKKYMSMMQRIAKKEPKRPRGRPTK